MSECILFSGYIAPDGYGRTSTTVNGTRYAHRVAYMEANGEILDSTVVRHLCNNRACINPEHLAIGTQQDNISDCIRSKRRAEDNMPTWLTDEQVEFCLRNYKPRCRQYGTRALGRLFKVPNEVISLTLRSGKSPHRR